MKHAQACLTAREDRESSLHRCGGPERPVHVRERHDNAVLNSEVLM